VGLRAVRLVPLLVVAFGFVACGAYRPSLDGDLNTGRRAMLTRRPGEALKSFDRAVSAHPSSGLAHLWRGRALEELARFDEAAAAYARAVELEPSADHRLHAGALAGRVGDSARAIALLGDAVSAPSALRGPAETVVRLVRQPLAEAVIRWAVADPAAEALLRALIESGDDAAAVALAQARGWARPTADYCTATVPDLSDEGRALLAMVLGARNPDCLYDAGVTLTDAGRIRLARRVMRTVAESAEREGVRGRARTFLRHRLPSHEVAPLVEALTAAGAHLQLVDGLAVEARTAYDAAIAGDPAFSWPYRNIGLIWESRDEEREAFAWYQRAVAADPDDLVAQLGLGRVAYHGRRYDDALKAYRQVTVFDPDDVEGHVGVGTVLLAMGREADGVVALEEALARDPDHPEAQRLLEARARAGTTRVAAREDAGGHLARARQRLRDGRWEEAADAARQAAAVAPTSAASLLAAGGVVESVGDLETAKMLHEAAVAVAPTEMSVLVAAARFASRIGDDERVWSLADRIAGAEPWLATTSTRALPELGRGLVVAVYPGLSIAAALKVDVLLERGRIDEARALAGRFVLVRSGVDYCGQAQERLKDATSRDEIFQGFRRAVLAQPTRAECAWWFGQWLTDEGELRLARAMVTEARRATPGQDTKDSAARFLRIRLSGGREVAKAAEYLALLARRLVERGDDVHGRRLLEEAVRRDPGLVSAYNVLARLAWERGDAAEALARLERAVAVDAESWRAHRNLGLMLGQLQRPAAAELHLRRAVELFGEDIGARVALARALYAQGKLAEYAAQTRTALKVADAVGQPLPEVREFLEAFERRGAIRALPPTSMPRVALGWNAD